MTPYLVVSRGFGNSRTKPGLMGSTTRGQAFTMASENGSNFVGCHVGELGIHEGLLRLRPLPLSETLLG